MKRTLLATLAAAVLIGCSARPTTSGQVQPQNRAAEVHAYAPRRAQHATFGTVAVPVAPSDTVYVGAASKSYHRRDCNSLRRCRSISYLTRSEADAYGLKSCHVCIVGQVLATTAPSVNH